MTGESVMKLLQVPLTRVVMFVAGDPFVNPPLHDDTSAKAPLELAN